MASVVEHRQVELTQARRVGDRVYLDDLSVSDPKAKHQLEPSTGRHDDPHGAVNEGRSCGLGTPLDCPPGHLPRAADLCRCARNYRLAVGPEHDLRIEHHHERPEVAVPGGGEEGVHDLSLAGDLGDGRSGRSPHPAARPARELAGRLRRALNDRRDLVKRHVEHVVQNVCQSLGWTERLEHDQQREPDRVGEQRLVLGVRTLGGVDDPLWDARAERLLEYPDARGACSRTRAPRSSLATHQDS